MSVLGIVMLACSQRSRFRRFAIAACRASVAIETVPGGSFRTSKGLAHARVHITNCWLGEMRDSLTKADSGHIEA
jgi:hypothetical protein